MRLSGLEYRCIDRSSETSGKAENRAIGAVYMGYIERPNVGGVSCGYRKEERCSFSVSKGDACGTTDQNDYDTQTNEYPPPSVHLTDIHSHIAKNSTGLLFVIALDVKGS